MARLPNLAFEWQKWHVTVRMTIRELCQKRGMVREEEEAGARTRLSRVTNGHEILILALQRRRAVY